MLKLKTLLSVALLSIFLYACAPTVVTNLDLKYSPDFPENKATDIKIAVVRPKYSKADTKTVQNVLSNNMMSILNANLEKYTPADQKLINKYNTTFVKDIENSFFSDIQLIMKLKGLRVVQGVISEDELTYNLKKDLDFIVTTEFDLSPVINNKYSCMYMPVVGQTCSNSGTITVGGKVYLNFIEPLSKEKILIKTFDISALANSGQLQPQSYTDDEQALNFMVNMFNLAYPEIMKRIANIIDVDEIRINLADVKKLKDKKLN